MARKRVLSLLLAAVFIAGASVAVAQASSHHDGDHGGPSTSTPIKHLVVIFQENVSFDHYFATYPQTHPTSGDEPFYARRDTPSVNGLNTSLLAPNNPNSVQPFLLHRSQAATCDQNHDYTAEQQAFDHGLMDKFVETTGVGGPGCQDYGLGTGLVMGYYDGGTTTALWNYAQHFAMSDNSYGTNFGPSTVGALNLISGQTHGASGPSTEVTAGSVTGDPQPSGDVCTTRDNVTMSGRNIGNLLNDKGITWGWFNGGFRSADNKSATFCKQSHIGADGKPKTDYIPHHEPFQYYASTANPQHLPPTSVAMIGHQDQANHQYDLTDFWAALAAHNLPAVSFLKAPGYQDGHAGYSSPLLEQQFLVDTINRLEKSPEWRSTAVVIAYDDSDGWYDHQMGPIVNHSQTSADVLSGPGACGTNPPAGGYQGRCGYGPRLPLLVVSPFARSNFVDHSVTDQSSILRFIEDNWGTGQIGDASFDAKAGSLNNMFSFRGQGDEGAHRLFLDPSTGEPTHGWGWGG